MLCLFFMVAVFFINLVFRVGEWQGFWFVLVVQVWLGQAVYSFLSGDRIVFGGGFSLEVSYPAWIRLLCGIFAMVVFFLVSFI
ncbi:hypothetical protein [Atopomonas hussainii]|uniref:hypothetical protein n=1 Tax=Atopomonas hussainii TaxID=1429083 RepID=UPI001114869A|nr:hypothetical protein [Atopomonas hussainii]